MDFKTWPRMDRSTAEKVFHGISLAEGPEVNLATKNFDFAPIGQRITPNEMQSLRREIVNVAEQFGFKARYGYDQSFNPGNTNRELFDRELTLRFREWTSMRWAEAGSNEIWSWFSLALLPDVTHWRWKFTTQSQKGNWNKERWIGGDLTRHTWARYWWRSVRFQEAPDLITKLSETDFVQLLERADTLGTNPELLSAFGTELLAVYENTTVEHRKILYDSAQRMRRCLAYLDDSALSKEEMRHLVGSFFNETTGSFEA